MTGMFEWSDEFATGVGSVDAQHRMLFQIGAELYTAMSTGEGRAASNRILDKLVQYTAKHFAHEERLMQNAEYPELAAHRKQHEALTKQVMSFQNQVRSGRAVVTVQLLLFIKSWLEDHIKNTDRKYAPLLKAKAVA